jgi:2',3'-cyclic-nucleotide 2'-phosphodiesterase (5'-nucleotidase family)
MKPNFQSKFYTLFIALQCLVIVAFTQNLKVSVGNYRVDGNAKKDSAVSALIKSYKSNINNTMNTVIGFSVDGLTKKQPESGLGNFMTDAMLLMAEKKIGIKVDGAFINYGGVRGYIPKGDVTIGSIFELMPFDNLLILQTISGDSLQAFLNHVASRNGWPISGITFTIVNKMATNILVNGQPFDSAKTYTIANSDYIINGGDDVKMLKTFKQINKGYLIRDALIDYVKMQTEKGKSIDAKTEKRIVYGNE